MATAVKTLQNFVAGDWVEATGDEAREIVSPVTGEKLADAPNAGEEDIKRAAKAAREAQPKWAALSAWDRAKVCHAIADLIEERTEDFARELGVYMRFDDRGETCAQFAPPLVAGPEEFDEMVGVLRQVLDEAWDRVNTKVEA